MARIRTIKPEFWSDEKLSECSLSARLTFIGLWSFADDEGRMEFQLARLRMQIFPCGSVTLAKLTEYARELTEHSLIRVYLVDGKQYLDIPGFAKHQRINRPTESKLPEYSLNAHGGLSERSPLEGKGKEREGKGADAVASGVVTQLPLGDQPSRARLAPPPGLNEAAWSAWVEYRKAVGKALKPASLPAAMQQLAAFGPDQLAVVQQSIAAGWQGLFALKPAEKPRGGADNGLPTLNVG
jgi:hypothetical protein